MRDNMKTFLFLFLSVSLISFCQAQESNPYIYEPSTEYPYGRKNPDAPEQLADFAPLIGTCDCFSRNRNPDGSWQDSVKMIWTFEYIMNGMGVQDKTLKEDGRYAGSIRLFNADSAKWYVHYYSSSAITPRLNTWSGNKIDDKIVLTMPQKSPNGLDGISRLTFYDISENGFKWIGEWLNLQKTIVYPFWKISCWKKTENNQ